MPNTHVRWRPAFWGALVAAGLSEASKWAFGLYVSQALPYLKLYGAIGLVPLFLFWLYLGWLIILFGLEIAFTLQAMKGRVFEHKERRGALATADPQWLLAGDGGDRAGARTAAEPVSRQQLAEDAGPAPRRGHGARRLPRGRGARPPGVGAGSRRRRHARARPRARPARAPAGARDARDARDAPTQRRGLGRARRRSTRVPARAAVGPHARGAGR